MIDETKSKGTITLIKEYDNGEQETLTFNNTVLRTGRYALALSLCNEYGQDYEFYISTMLFGNGGTDDGSPKFVSAAQNGLFSLITPGGAKPVSSSIDPNEPSQVAFTAIIGKDELIGQTLNEMALRMANGDLYSMATFPDVNKTGTMQLTWIWRISFI